MEGVGGKPEVGNYLLGLFGLAMGPRSASHWPNMLEWH